MPYWYTLQFVHENKVLKRARESVKGLEKNTKLTEVCLLDVVFEMTCYSFISLLFPPFMFLLALC